MDDLPSDPKLQPATTKRRRTQQEKLLAAKAREEKAAEAHRRRKVAVQKLQAHERTLDRKADTRRKIIAGALALKHRELDGIWAKTLGGLVDEYVTRDQDRALFELAPLEADDPRRKVPMVF